MSHLCHGLICNSYRNYCAVLNFKFGECQVLVEKNSHKKTHEPVQHHAFGCSTLNLIVGLISQSRGEN